MMLTQWVTRDILVTVKARVDGDPRKTIRLVVGQKTTLDELSLAIKNAVDIMSLRDVKLVEHSMLWVITKRHYNGY